MSYPSPQRVELDVTLESPGLVVLAPVYVLLGAMFVSIDLSTVAFAQHFGHKPLAGFILGTYAFGSGTATVSTPSGVVSVLPGAWQSKQLL